MDVKDLRYIVFGIDTKSHTAIGTELHDGQIFKSLATAKEFALESIDEGHFNKFIIGMFLLDPLLERMHISMIESFGFKGNRMDPRQLSLWKDI